MTSSPGLPTLVDTHCHLDYVIAPKDPEKNYGQILREAQIAGVETLVSVATDLVSAARNREISEQSPERSADVFTAVGIHPHEAGKFDVTEISKLAEASKHSKCVAIGEIGLDYHYKFSTPEDQKHVLGLQLELARNRGLPVIIHAREAEDDLLNILSDHVRSLVPGSTPGVIHCFTGTQHFASECIELGFYISFSGVITFKNANAVRDVARSVPSDKILIETDSPFLAPVPFRGKRCEPSMLTYTANALADLRDIPFFEIARITTDNARKLFKLPVRF